MTSAARRLGVTQPALSKQLKSLQARLDSPLLREEGRRLRPTEFGDAMYRQLRPRFVGLDEDVRDVIVRSTSDAPPRLRIAARREILDRLITTLASPAALTLLEAGHAAIHELLESRSTEIAIDYELPDSGQWIAKPLFHERFELWIPKSLLRRPPDEKDWSPLQDLPALAYRERDELLERAVSERNLLPERLRIAGITGNYRSLWSWVRAGRGWAVLPAYLTDDRDGCWRVPIPARSLPAREFFVIYRREHVKNRWLREVLTQMQGAFKP